MAAAYAALMSLMHTLEMILHPSQQLGINRIQIESLLQMVRSLQEFLEDYSHRDHEEMAALGSRIADTARAADIVIDYHVLEINSSTISWCRGRELHLLLRICTESYKRDRGFDRDGSDEY